MLKRKRKKLLALFKFRKTLLCSALLSTLVFLVLGTTLLSEVPHRKVLRKVDAIQWKFVNISVIQNHFKQRQKLPEKTEHQSFKNHFFNAQISDLLPFDRQIPDTRSLECRTKGYDLGTEKSQVSVIISFHNEAKSALLRTIVSILNRTPSDLLKEIVLIDDFSDKDISDILTSLSKVRYFRNEARRGLIKSRNLGAFYATGSHLLFLDSHCEVNLGWLEPLLLRSLLNPGALVSPIIDIIDPNSFEYKASSTRLKGGFDWSLRFKWIPRTDEEIQAINDDTVPFVSPSTYGGIFLISKKWFLDLGQFNADLEIWGGESLDMSIKSWLCGGQIEVVPCSRVGHVFRKRHPYSFPGNGGIAGTLLRNSKIIAENWLEEFKKFFYLERPQAIDLQVSISKLNSTQIKDRLQCRSFIWYLQNIFPELKIPNEKHVAFGELRNGDRCMIVNSFGRLEVGDCFLEEKITKWALHNGTGMLSAQSGGCLTVAKDNLEVKIDFCKTKTYNFASQQWHRNRGNLINTKSGRCLEHIVGSALALSECRANALSQLWHFSVEIQQQV